MNVFRSVSWSVIKEEQSAYTLPIQLVDGISVLSMTGNIEHEEEAEEVK